MGVPVASGQLKRVEDFQRRHRVGLVVLLFTDIVGSTELKQRCGDQEAVALIQEHHALVRALLTEFSQAEEVETAGDSFLLMFGRPSEAVSFALALQARLRALVGESGKLVKDRIGIHVGEVFIQTDRADAKLFGIQVDTCARVMALAQGNQVLMTRFAFDNARSVLRGTEMKGVGALRWMNHGPYLLKGVEEPIEVCEAGEEGAPLTPPANSEKAHRHISAEAEPVLGWRPALGQVVPNTKWTLEKKLGEGGFGEVWLGHHDTLKEKRVFKFCFRADRVRSLKREVTLFRVLKERVGHHPNIVGIQEVFFDAPPFYIVMDYAEGQDLRAWCERQGGVETVPLSVRLEIVAQVADALQAAHEAGVIHRDVKPSNILVSGRRSEVGGQQSEVGGRKAVWSAAAKRSDDAALASGGDVSPGSATLASAAKAGSPLADSLCPRTPQEGMMVKLTDFGIGQVVTEEALAGMTRMGFTQTMMGPGSSSHTGTQLYMAPELMAGKPASTRSDIYSLGVVLYQLLMGDFTCPLTTDWRKRVSDPLLRDDLEKCFAGNPETRFASPGELGANLRSLERRRFQSNIRRMLRIAAAVLGVVAVLAVGFYAFKRSQRPTLLGVGVPKDLITILVLPFTNASPEKTDAYLGRSLTQESIRRMRLIHRLNPLLFTNVAKAQDRDFLGALPGIRVLGGSVEKTRDQLKINLHLLTAGGDQLPAEPIVSNLSELPAVPSGVAQQVAQSLDLELSPEEVHALNRKPTQNLEAFDAYLHGLAQLNQSRKILEADQVMDFFRRATRADPSFALGFVGLADACNQMASTYKPELAQEAFGAVQTALRLDKQLAEGYVALGGIYWSAFGKFDGENAVPNFQQGLKLSSTVEHAHEGLLFVFSHWGLLNEALKEAEEELAIHRFNHQARWYKSTALLGQGKYRDVLKELEQLPPGWLQDTGLVEYEKALCHFQMHYEGHDAQGELQKASAILAALPTDPPAPVVSSLQAMIYATTGQTNKAEKQIQITRDGEKRITHFHHASYQIGAAYAIMQRKAEALTSLRKSTEEGFPCYPYFALDPSLTNLRGDVEFGAFMKELKAQMEKRRATFGRR